MKFIKCFTLLCVLMIGLSGGSQAAIYTLDITLLTDYINLGSGDPPTPEYQIAGVSFNIAGDQTGAIFTLGSAIPTGWISDNDGNTYSVLSKFNILDPPYNPIISTGGIVTIDSPATLVFSDLFFYSASQSGISFGDLNSDGIYDTYYDNGGNPISGSYFRASGNIVPIPAAVWLLGSGIVGLVALKRRKR